MAVRPDIQRSIGLWGATSIGVGAIVGGGILALSGVAFAETGPSAILAFACNGLIAFITALSFAELATQFPESGGTYSFAKRVLPFDAAFTVGWVVWFASIVAAVLYAFGFGVFAAITLDELGQAAFASAYGLASSHGAIVGLGSAATLVYTVGLLRRAGGGGHWPNIGKVLVFAILIGAGLWGLAGHTYIREQMTPFMTNGSLGFCRAMGYTFIALQGFDLIAAVAGEVREPRRTLPRAMILSLLIALAIYLPLLFIVMTVGTPPGTSVAALGAEHPEAVVAIAARNYLGDFGYWLVLVAGILSMLSALRSNLLAASRIALAMARDRTLPNRLTQIHARRGTPGPAILTTAMVVIVVLLVIPSVAVVGAASSLVFLVSFALVHRISIMARRRGGVDRPYYRTPFFPVVPTVGLIACVALALFQGISVPIAGIIICAWLVVGGILYLSLFARRARVLDAYSQALDGELVRLRGRSPLVLVPIANPSNAEAMVGVATALAHPQVGRVLLLSVVPQPDDRRPLESPKLLDDTQSVIRGALTASFSSGLAPEALLTVASQPWTEIARVARTHRCETLLMGLSTLSAPGIERRLEELMGHVGCDVVILRAPRGWKLSDVRRVLVPIGGLGGHDELRARLLASIHRLGARQVTLMRVLTPGATDAERARAQTELTSLAREEVPGDSRVVIETNADVASVVAQYSEQAELVVLGLQRLGQRRKVFGEVALRVAGQTSCGIIMISRRG